MKFKKTNKSTIGTSLSGTFTGSYYELVEILGEPNSNGDACKISTKWILEDVYGNVVTIYDYKATELYSKELPTVEEFRELPEYEWHVGSKNKEVAQNLIGHLLYKSSSIR